MWWKYLLEALLAAMIIGCSSSFWSLFKAPNHLREFLCNEEELRSFIRFLGAKVLAEEATAVKPSFGSFADNIRLFETAHLEGLKQSSFMFAIFSSVILIGSYFMGYSFPFINVALFFLSAAFPPSASVKNQNVTHVHTVILNLLKWRVIDPLGVSKYSKQERPEFKTLYSILDQEVAD